MATPIPVNAAEFSLVEIAGATSGEMFGDASLKVRGVSIDSRNLKGGELLFAWSGTPGTSFGAHVWQGREALLNQHIFRVDFDEKTVEKRFFKYAINQKLDELIGKAHGGVGLRHVTKGKFQQTAITVPPRAEQARIADKLESLLGESDSCRERLDRVLHILKKFREAVLEAAVSGKLTEEWRTAEGAVVWKTRKAGDACELITKGTTPIRGFASAGVPFLKVYNIVDQKVEFTPRSQFVNMETHERELARSKIFPGDVLMNIVGPPLGKVALIPHDFPEWNINQALALFRPRVELSSQWLYFVLCSGVNLRSIVRETHGMVGQANISLAQCRDFDIPIPSLSEQTEIVRRIVGLFTWAQSVQTKCELALSAAIKLTPSLLAKAFRGELVRQDLNDEPAGDMLERVTAAAANKSSKRAKTNGVARQ